MIVAGGIYRERCSVPEWDYIYGSGGRGAAALTALSGRTKLYSYVGSHERRQIEMTLGAVNVDVVSAPTEQTIAFDYFHPLSVPEHDWDGRIHAALIVKGDVVLRYGFMEGDAVVTATTAVFDPQSSGVRFEANGSSAPRLATVLNDIELRAHTGVDDVAAAATSLLRNDDDVVVVKRGARGAEVYRRKHETAVVPAYRTERVFKIGTGDVFSAVFAHYWAEADLDAAAAADRASRAVAHYVSTGALPIPDAGLEVGDALSTDFSPGRVYLAGPFFTLSQRWLIEELLAALSNMGAQVFSPFHEIGLCGGRGAAAVAEADLDGLRGCDAVLAVLDGSDPGTIFEAGYARSLGMPVVALAENVQKQDLTMLEGSGCDIAPDLTTAVYKTIWASMR